MDLTKGNIIKISYYWKKEIELNDKQKQENRTKSIGGEIEATLSRMIYGQANITDLQLSVKKGYEFAKKLDHQEFFNIKETWIQIGDMNSLTTIHGIESNPLFGGWIDPYQILMIKQSYDD